MTNVARYAYQATWDGTQLTRGLMNSRQLFSAQKKIVEDSRTPFERLAIGQENLNKLIEKFPDLASQRIRMEQQLEKIYLVQEQAIRKLDAAEQERLNNLLTSEEKQESIAARQKRRNDELNKVMPGATKIVDAQTPFDKLAEGTDRLNKLAAEFPEIQQRRLEIERKLEKQYLLEEQSVRKLDRSERERLRSLMTTAEREAEIAARREKMAARMQKLGEKVNAQWATRDMLADDAARNKAAMSAGPNWAAKSGGAAGVAVVGQSSMLGDMAKFAGIYKVTGAITDLVTNSREALHLSERLRVDFEQFGGDAAGSVARLRDMAHELGVSYRGLATGAGLMMKKGFSADDAISQMKVLAQVTGGVPAEMEGLAYVFAQISSKGRLMAEELDQLAERGFSPLPELAKVLGVELTSVRDEIAKGTVTWDVFRESVGLMVKEGGRSFGYLEKFKETNLGAATAAASAWENAFERIGKSFSGLDNFWSKASEWAANDIAGLFEGGLFSEGGLRSSQFLDLSSYAEDGIPQRFEKAFSKLESHPAMQKLMKQNEHLKKMEDKRKEYLKRMADIRASEEAAIREQSKLVESGASDMEFNLIKQMAPEAEVERFERLYGLLTDFNKEKAKIGVIENFKSGLGLGDLTDMLDEQAKKEWERTEALREQSIELAKQQELLAKQRDLRRETEENSKRLAEQYMSDDERMTQQLVDIELARRQGHLTGANYDRAINDVVGDRSRGGGSLASNMMMGSQQAYQFMAGIQDQRNRIEMSRHKESVTIQKLQLEVMKRVEQRLEELDLSTEK